MWLYHKLIISLIQQTFAGSLPWATLSVGVKALNTIAVDLPV